MPVTLIYETHLTTTDSEAGIATGWLPGELSERGRDLAREPGVRRAADDLAAVFVSDLRRALETAQLAFGTRDLPICQDLRLRECNYGELNGLSVAQLASVRGRHIVTPFLGDQSYTDVIGATRGFLRDLARGWDWSQVLVSAHSASRRALECLLLGRSTEELVGAPFDWQPGWHYSVPAQWGDPT